MPDTADQTQEKKARPPEVILAEEVLARVRGDAPQLADAWLRKLPSLALRMAKNGLSPEAGRLEQIVREDWQSSRIESLFARASGDATRPVVLTYEEVVASLPAQKKYQKPENLWDLSDACEAGRLDKVRQLVEAGADIHENQEVALRLAAQHGHLGVVKYLVEKGANVDAFSGDALRLAAEEGHLPVVKYLLDKGADIHAQDNHALRLAARYGHLGVVKYLLDKGADIHASSDEALYYAAEGGYLNVVRCLLDRGADAGAGQGRALWRAAQMGHLGIVRHMLERDGVKAKITPFACNSIMTGAASGGHIPVMNYLLTKHGDVFNDHIDEAFRTAAHQGKLKMVRYLLERKGRKANIRANDDAALRWAAKEGQVESMRCLLERDGEKADIHARDDEALRLAVHHEKLEAVHYLLEKKGEKADIKALGEAALETVLGVEKGVEMACYLIEQGADRKIIERYPKWSSQTPESNKFYQARIREMDRGLTALARWRKVTRRPAPQGLLFLDPEGINHAALVSCCDWLRKEFYMPHAANLYAYHAVKLFGNEQNVLRYLQKWGHAGKQALHEVVHDISCPQREKPADSAPPEWDRKIWADAVMVRGPKMASVVKFAGRVIGADPATGKKKTFVPMRAKNGDLSISLTIQEAAKYAYKNAAKHPVFAKLCFDVLVDEPGFERGLKIIAQTSPDIVKNIPDIEIAGEEFGMPGARWRRLAANDTKGLLLGKYTDCCQHIEGAGKECAAHGYRSPDSGFYVLEKEGGEIVGQSWAWRGKKGELVLDSLEALGEHVGAREWRRLMDAFAARLAQEPGDVCCLNIGTGGKTPNNAGWTVAAKAAVPVDCKGYRDSGDQYCVARFMPTLSFAPARGYKKPCKSPSPFAMP